MHAYLRDHLSQMWIIALLFKCGAHALECGARAARAACGGRVHTHNRCRGRPCARWIDAVACHCRCHCHCSSFASCTTFTSDTSDTTTTSCAAPCASLFLTSIFAALCALCAINTLFVEHRESELALCALCALQIFAMCYRAMALWHPDHRAAARRGLNSRADEDGTHTSRAEGGRYGGRMRWVVVHVGSRTVRRPLATDISVEP